ncbi:C10 family peptidase [Porphyromonas circumdentaria]|uniref:Por secretion system C-terminal sorting domain-containing protein n=1 Tax=Porphyromonas circumdentaria TaxID=29524 RepID=A0A1T4NHA2_9PORP|nr:C10 family peptidase [Porphyromonas circumdentaria]MBB6275685.1 hypothetical protein [Porphyromonas circumdentaria]SJZ78417.1 Por secretion system C-terminal sorting domain-containing protein [Porphyromonas circumdentaria]
MKKVVTTIVSFIGAHLLLTAGPVTPQQAKSIAEEVLGQNSLRGGRTIELTYTHTPQTLRQGISEAQQPYYYIFNRGTGDGFAIVSGDDRMYPVLAYADQGYFDMQNLPEHIRAWMQYYDKSIEELLKTPDFITTSTATPKRSASTYPAVAPILDKIKWNQDYPYSSATPSNMPTGCVATAAAQIMRYYRWPDESIGGPISYYDVFSNITRTVTFGTKYNWDKMPESYSVNDPTYTQEKVAQVGYLLRDVGLGARMNYSAGGSGAWEHNLVKTLRENFKYNKGLSLKLRYNHNAKEWEELIQKELQAKRPVFYTGYQTGGGHAFVCDGYNQEGLYHFNWGWGGMADGYFRLTALKPTALGIGAGLGDYSIGQGILVGFEPDKTGTSTLAASTPPSASIRIQETLDKEAIMLKGNVIQRTEDLISGTLRITVKNKNNSTSKLTEEKRMSLQFQTAQSFSQNIAFASYEDGEYELCLEWKGDKDSNFGALSMYADEPDKAFFKVENKKVKEWSYNAAIDLLSFDKTKTKAEFYAFSSSKLTIGIENKSDREYYGPIKILATTVSSATHIVPTGREFVVLESVICVPAKQTITHTFEDFIPNLREDVEINIFAQYAEPKKGEPDTDFGHHIQRYRSSYAYLCGEKITVTRPQNYQKTTIVCTPETTSTTINVGGASFSTPSFKIENRGEIYSQQFDYAVIRALIVGEVQGQTRILAVSNNTAPTTINRGEEVTFTPVFYSDNTLRNMKGRNITILLKSIYNNTFADHLLPLMGTTYIRAKVSTANAIEAKDNVKGFIYPNPASSSVKVNSPAPIFSIDIFSMSGALVLSQKGELQQELTVNVNELPEGNYLMGVRDDKNQVVTHRLQIAR